MGERPLTEISEELGDRLHFEEAGIKDFLSKHQEAFDLIVLAKTPDHGLDTPEDYKLLASKVKSGGFVLTVAIDPLWELFMRTSFKHIPVEAPTENDTATAAICDLWRRV